MFNAIMKRIVWTFVWFWRKSKWNKKVKKNWQQQIKYRKPFKNYWRFLYHGKKCWWALMSCQVLRLGGAKYIFKGARFFFITYLKEIFLGPTTFGGTKNLGWNCLRMPPRGYGPADDTLTNNLFFPVYAVCYIATFLSNLTRCNCFPRRSD